MSHQDNSGDKGGRRRSEDSTSSGHQNKNQKRKHNNKHQRRRSRSRGRGAPRNPTRGPKHHHRHRSRSKSRGRRARNRSSSPNPEAHRKKQKQLEAKHRRQLENEKHEKKRSQKHSRKKGQSVQKHQSKKKKHSTKQPSRGPVRGPVRGPSRKASRNSSASSTEPTLSRDAKKNSSSNSNSPPAPSSSSSTKGPTKGPLRYTGKSTLDGKRPALRREESYPPLPTANRTSVPQSNGNALKSNGDDNDAIRTPNQSYRAVLGSDEESEPVDGYSDEKTRPRPKTPAQETIVHDKPCTKDRKAGSIRLASYNVENLVARYHFRPSTMKKFRTPRNRDHEHKGDFDETGQSGANPGRSKSLPPCHPDGFTANDLAFSIFEQTQKRITAETIRDADADILALMEVESLRVLDRFNAKYLANMGYKYTALMEAHDPRYINIAILSRFPIELIRSHKDEKDDQGRWLFSRDCLEVIINVHRTPLWLYINHFKAMGGNDEGGRHKNKNRRRNQAARVVDLLEQRWGARGFRGNFAVLGDLNDKNDFDTAIGNLIHHPELVNVVERLPEADQWTHYYSFGDTYQQLDYILLGSLLAENSPGLPGICRQGLPLRVLKYDGPRSEGVGHHRPKASDHALVYMDIHLIKQQEIAYFPEGKGIYHKPIVGLDNLRSNAADRKRRNSADKSNAHKPHHHRHSVTTKGSYHKSHGYHHRYDPSFSRGPLRRSRTGTNFRAPQEVPEEIAFLAQQVAATSAAIRARSSQIKQSSKVAQQLEPDLPPSSSPPPSLTSSPQDTPTPVPAAVANTPTNEEDTTQLEQVSSEDATNAQSSLPPDSDSLAPSHDSNQNIQSPPRFHRTTPPLPNTVAYPPHMQFANTPHNFHPIHSPSQNRGNYGMGPSPPQLNSPIMIGSRQMNESPRHIFNSTGHTPPPQPSFNWLQQNQHNPSLVNVQPSAQVPTQPTFVPHQPNMYINRSLLQPTQHAQHHSQHPDFNPQQGQQQWVQQAFQMQQHGMSPVMSPVPVPNAGPTDELISANQQPVQEGLSSFTNDQNLNGQAQGVTTIENSKSNESSTEAPQMTMETSFSQTSEGIHHAQTLSVTELEQSMIQQQQQALLQPQQPAQPQAQGQPQSQPQQSPHYHGQFPVQPTAQTGQIHPTLQFTQFQAPNYSHYQY